MKDLLIQTLLCIPVLIFNGYVTLRVYHRLNIRREMRFLKHLKIIYPDAVITFTAIEASDHESLKKLKAQLDVQ